jgi:amylosucrase
MVVANFDANIQVLNASWLEKLGYLKDGSFMNLVDGSLHHVNSGLLQIKPYELLWILRN